MVELLLPLFMGLYSPEEPVVYEVVSQTGDSITLKLSDSRKSDSPSTVSLPKTLFLMNSAVWRPLGYKPEIHGITSYAPPKLLTQAQQYFDEMLVWRTQMPAREEPAAAPRVECNSPASTQWQALLRLGVDEERIRPLSCEQQSALALFLKAPDVDEAVIPDEGAADEYADDGFMGSSVFSVLNATIPTASAPPPVWHPTSELSEAKVLQQVPEQSFIFPLTSSVTVTSPYGLRYHPILHRFMRHEGVDLRAALNSNVLSVSSGVVSETGYGPATGLFVTINHAEGWSSRYLHLNQILVAKGERVAKGNVIALSGTTGRSNGPHLHLEVSHNGRLLNPMEVLFARIESPSNQPIASAVPSSAPTPAELAPEPIDMTPAITVISGDAENLQVGVRIGRRTAFYSPKEIIETEEGSWRIVEKFGKYKLVKIESKK
jgi:murein DD-endopeptidase